MRIAFFDPTNEQLTAQQKGKLFEKLAFRILESAGYVSINLRSKHNSLEYDIEAAHSLTQRRVMGEAKAHDAAIPGSDVAAFVGKLVPIKGPVDGIFISTSPFTPDARSYIAAVNENPLGQDKTFRTIAGEQVYEFLATQRSYVPESTLRDNLSQRHGLVVLDSWLAVTHNQDYIVCTCGPNLLTAPTHYAILSSNGTELQPDYLQTSRLISQIADLQGLALLGATGPRKAEQPRDLPGIAAGSGWFDYKFPTSPDYFIGRAEALDQLTRQKTSIQTRKTALRVLQVLGRSGVGKSSLLLKLANDGTGCATVTIDGRAIRVATDTRLVVNQLSQTTFAQSDKNPPLARSQDEVANVLVRISEQLEQDDRIAVVQIDQFESLLSLPVAFQELLDLMNEITTEGHSIVWILARKSDLAATYDQSAAVDLASLNGMSATIHLADFNALESNDLLKQLGTELGENIRKELAEAISTFSAGFPWLHKRLCAHVISMRQQGISQRELLQGGLRADDLFEEDLAVLPEVDRGLLRKLAAHMPNTSAELARRLENDISPQRLTEKLNSFLSTKLIRLSGDVYDTYNDVFKTYLVTDRVPFQSRYVFRVTPKATMKLLERIDELGPQELSQFQATIGGNHIAVVNKLRELRLLGFIDSQPGIVKLTPSTQAALDAANVGDLLRKAILGNALATAILEQVRSKGEVNVKKDVVSELKRQLPNVNVTDETWSTYATLLAAWLQYAGLVNREGDIVRVRTEPPSRILEGRSFSRGTFSDDTFLPTVRPKKVVELLEMLRRFPSTKTELYERFSSKETAGLLRDAASLDLIAIDEDTVAIGRQGQALLMRCSKLVPRDVAEVAIGKPNVKALLDASSSAPLSESQQRATLSKFGTARWKDSTWRWRLGRLRAWLVATGYAKSSARGLAGMGLPVVEQEQLTLTSRSS